VIEPRHVNAAPESGWRFGVHTVDDNVAVLAETTTH
jgi:hypothetical protein